tara:strand:- start:92 stop:331 length:240 start_codon:yes stop_codon:yes gene_type:complete
LLNSGERTLHVSRHRSVGHIRPHAAILTLSVRNFCERIPAATAAHIGRISWSVNLRMCKIADFMAAMHLGDGATEILEK